MSSTERRRFCCDADLALIGYDGRDAAKDLAALRAQGPRHTKQRESYRREVAAPDPTRLAQVSALVTRLTPRCRSGRTQREVPPPAAHDRAR
jgi:hypothetical protein